MRRSFPAIALACLVAGSALAQQSNDGYDFDTLSACSIIYQRTGEIYGEQGDAAQATSFQETAHAYSSTAFQMLLYADPDADQADLYEWSEERMQDVTESLNESSEAHPEGDVGVISEWLPYCDTLGEGVGELASRRLAEGW